jgi:hypothetical protein
MEFPVVNKKYGTENLLAWLIKEDPKLGSDDMADVLLDKAEAYINSLDLSKLEYDMYLDDARARVLGY